MSAHALLPTLSHKPVPALIVVRPQWVSPGYPAQTIQVVPATTAVRHDPPQPRLLWSADEDFDG